MAIGHSARDTFEMLYQNQIALFVKPFAVGLRIEHLQKDVNQEDFGSNHPLAGMYFQRQLEKKHLT